MGTRDWLAGWSRRSSRLLADAETPDARAGLVDTNGDGRELWFGLEVRSPTGDWVMALELDDVDGHHPAERLNGSDVIFGWGTSKPRERRLIEYAGAEYPVRAGSDGWWLLVADLAGEHGTDTRSACGSLLMSAITLTVLPNPPKYRHPRCILCPSCSFSKRTGQPARS